MQADYAPCRDTIRVSDEAHTTGARFTVFCQESPDNPTRNVTYDGKMLQDQGFLQIDKPRAIPSDSTFESIQWIRLTHSPATKQFPEKAERPAN